MFEKYEITKKHYNAIIAICGGLLNLEDDFLDLMRLHNVPPQLQKKIIMCLRLSNVPSSKFMTNDRTVLSYIITYLLHKLVHHREVVDNCLLELEKRMQKEYKQKIMTKDEYMGFRRTNFEIVKMIEFLCYNSYSLTILKDNTFLIQKSID
jgi:hypothetical protein